MTSMRTLSVLSGVYLVLSTVVFTPGVPPQMPVRPWQELEALADYVGLDVNLVGSHGSDYPELPACSCTCAAEVVPQSEIHDR